MDFILKLERAREEFNLSGRGDIVQLTAFYNFISVSPNWPQQNIMLCFILAWALREPPYVIAFEAALRLQPELTVDIIFDCLETLIPLHCVREFTPPMLWNFSNLKPASLMMFDRVLLFSTATYITSIFESEVTVAQYKKVTKEIAKLPHIGIYSKEHFFRTLCCVTHTTEPSTSFIIMGSGACKKKYDVLRRLGFNNMFDINAQLGVPMSAGELACYLCMGDFKEYF